MTWLLLVVILSDGQLKAVPMTSYRSLEQCQRAQQSVVDTVSRVRALTEKAESMCVQVKPPLNV